jgi:hypothetical protein
MDKVKNFDEFYGITEGLFSHAEWVDLDLLQGTIERMRSDEYKDALAALNSNFPMNSNVKLNTHIPEEE